MEAKVPQRIDMEDRVVGPLTLVQFFYLLFGGLFIYILNNWTSGSLFRIFFYPIALIIALVSLALAFLKINDRPFIYFAGSLVRYLRTSHRRVWAQGQHQQLTKIVEKVEEAKPKIERKPLDRERVEDLARILDTK